jgi:hypothetical protein
VDSERWFESLPATDAAVPCGTGTHTVRWAAGQLTLPAHPDAEAELVLGALGGDKPECVTLTETWARHGADLAVLTAGPRCAADLVSIGWDEVAEQRANMPAGWAQGISVPMVTAPTGPAPGSRRAALAGPWTGPGIEEARRRQMQRIELLELLALGPKFQFRLTGTVAAAWAGPDRAGDRAERRPAFTAALTGRFAPAAQEWLGIDPDAVTLTPYEGPGWGTVEMTGTGAGRRLRASLPVGWLADVWACGMAVAGGYLVVAVEEPGYPLARVLALPAPDAEPVAIAVRAAGEDPAGFPAWEVAGGLQGGGQPPCARGDPRGSPAPTSTTPPKAPGGARGSPAPTSTTPPKAAGGSGGSSPQADTARTPQRSATSTTSPKAAGGSGGSSPRASSVPDGEPDS